MIVICESCKTRFKLADERIPPAGAKVRCSRCKYSFHVAPPRREPEPSMDLLDPREETLAGLTEDTATGGGEPDLDIPEFLFEPLSGAEDDPLFGPGTGDEPDLGCAEAEPREVPEPLQVVEPPEVAELAAGAGPDPEEGVGTEPEKTESEDPLGSWEPFDDAGAAAQPPSRGESRAGERSAGSLRDAPFANAQEEESWDPACLASISALPDPVLAMPEEVRRPETSSGAPASEEVMRPERGAWEWLPRWLAAGLALALLAGGVRVLDLHAIRDLPGPEQVEGSGWVATQVRVLARVDARGRRLLVVRGALHPRQGGPPPRVEVTLLDARRQPIETGPSEAALLRQGDRSPPVRGPPARVLPGRGPVDGFELVIPDPPWTARRVRIELLPG